MSENISYESLKEEYLHMAKKYLVDKANGRLTDGICITIRMKELFDSSDPEKLIINKLESVKYDFSEVYLHTDNYGIDYLLFYNK